MATRSRTSWKRHPHPPASLGSPRGLPFTARLAALADLAEDEGLAPALLDRALYDRLAVEGWARVQGLVGGALPDLTPKEHRVVVTFVLALMQELEANAVREFPHAPERASP